MTHPEFQNVRPTRLARLFPWTRLLRAPSIALDTRKLVLGAIGLILSWIGTTGLDRMFQREVHTSILSRSQTMIGPSPSVTSLDSMLRIVAEPFVVMIQPFFRIFQTEPGLDGFFHAILSAIWLVLVWGILGGAIARIAAIQHSTGRRIGLVPAVRFALTRFVPLVGAPLSPMIGIAFFTVLCVPIGLLYRIPGNVGTTLAGILGFLPMLAGLVMALLLAGLAIGWPLMTATVAVEADDAFDTLSRSYSYVTQRPGLYGAYALVSWGVGIIGFAVISLLSGLVIQMAIWGLTFGGVAPRVSGLFLGDPNLGETPAAIHSFWISAVRLLTHSWLYGYFFTAVTLIYVLLRKDVDGTPFHELGGMSSQDEPFLSPAGLTSTEATDGAAASDATRL